MTFTEATLLDALRRRHAHEGNGGSGRYAFLTHVRTGGGHEQQEMDAVVVALWPGEYYDVHAFEVKCSRTDWLREIKPDTSKSAAARSLCDTFSIVAPTGIVQDGELPTGWGLLEASERDGTIKLRLKHRPERLTPTPLTWRNNERTFDRGLVVAMLRAAGTVPGMTTGKRRTG